MHVESLKREEIPGGIRVVIADDEENVAARTSQAWSTILEGSSLPSTSEVVTATSGDDMLAKALGLMGPPADVVILDDNYKATRVWKPTEGMLELIAQKQGVPFEAIKKPDRGNHSVVGAMPDDLYYPNSTHFALLLRFFGFSGTIIVASSDPPDPGYVQWQADALNKYIQSFDATIGENPINGVITKPSREHKSYYATAPGTSGKYWGYKEIQINDYSEAFLALIAAL